MKIMIYGSGNSACGHAAILSNLGHEVHLYDMPQFASNLEPVKALGGFNLTGYIKSFSKISLITTDLDEALEDVQVILVIVPAFAHKSVAENLASKLSDDHIVCLSPAGPFGSIIFRNLCKEAGCKAKFKLVEIVTSVLAARRHSADTVWIKGIKEHVAYAAYPASDLPLVKPIVDQVMPYLESTPNIIYTTMANNNTVVHPITAVLNAARIESQPGGFDFYWDGIQPCVGECMEALDKERVAICKAMGFEVKSMLQQMHDFYDHHGGYEGKNTLFDFFDHGYVNGGPGSTGPKDLKHRYITEDVPFGLVPLVQTARLFGVKTPVMDAVITLASVFNKEDYLKTGRTLESAGLGGLSKEEFLDKIING